MSLLQYRDHHLEIYFVGLDGRMPRAAGAQSI
ncbi:MAG: hypothetical protein QOG79_7278 [Mycobacterium sp.]|jgi:hypothetical protein|nr:hypothetical protein [Mycobacterium sp.]